MACAWVWFGRLRLPHQVSGARSGGAGGGGIAGMGQAIQGRHQSRLGRMLGRGGRPVPWRRDSAACDPVASARGFVGMKVSQSQHRPYAQAQARLGRPALSTKESGNCLANFGGALGVKPVARALETSDLGLWEILAHGDLLLWLAIVGRAADQK